MFNKTTKQLFVWLGLTLAAVISVNVQPLPCSFFANCTNEGPGVWATDNERCFVFANACQLTHENCQRRNASQTVLVEIPKEECQKLCANVVCLQVYRPVCAVLNGNYRTFGNSCTLGNYICTSGELYTFVHEGECGKESKSTV